MVSPTVALASLSSPDFSPSLLPANSAAPPYGRSSSSSSLCSLSSHHTSRTHLPRALSFSDHQNPFSFESSVEHQLPLPPSSFTARASLGRLSGAVHGSTCRKGARHKRPDKAFMENDREEFSNSLQDKEFIDESSLEVFDDNSFCDDMPYAKESDCYFHHDDKASAQNCMLLPTTHMYDSIHGDFWLNDPYYQEVEALEMEIARQNRMQLESTKEPAIPADTIFLRETGKSTQGALQTSLNEWPRSSKQGDGKSRNGAIIAHESLDLPDNRSASTHRGSVAVPMRENNTSSQELSSTELGYVRVLEGCQVSSLDGQKPSYQQDKVGNAFVREVGGAGPLVGVGSLQNVESSILDHRQGSGNEEVDGMDLKCESPTEEHSANLDDTPNLLSSDRSRSNEVSDASTALKDHAEGSGNQVLTALALPMVEHVGQVVEQVEILPDIPDPIKQQVVMVVDQVENLPQVPEQVVSMVVDQVVEVLPDPVVEQVGQVAEQVSQTAEQIVEQVTSHVVEPISTTASQLVNFLSREEDDDESDDEFEAYRSLDLPEFKGRQGLDNFTILQEEQGIVSIIYDFYIFMLKRSLFEFMLGMFAAPILLSVIFTILYLPEFNGLALDETVRQFLDSGADAKGGLPGLQISWLTIFQVFMFSVSLSTGLQPELAPLSPYTLIVANLNALLAQLIFVFLSGAVFARLSQPSQPVKCSKVAVICPAPSNRRLRKEPCYKALLARYVLVGPQPCELVDVKVDLTYHYNTVTRFGTYFRTSQSLKLVRPEIAFLNHGMLVRHIIDDASPLFQRTHGMLEKEDAVFSLSVVGLERSSMQSVFHVQHYCVHDKDVVWDAEFVDMILINKKNRRVVDHSLLSTWRPVVPKPDVHHDQHSCQ